MRLFLLTALVMVAFAANSVLTRAGLVTGEISPAGFGAVRLGAGAVVLVFLCLWLRRRLALPGWRLAVSVLGLLLYTLGFSEAYVGMDAGLGALLLFGMVQVTMFAGAMILREALPWVRVLGGGLALAGLVYLVWPWQAIAQTPTSVMMMLLAGAGWGLYSLAGRGSDDPLADTAVNFALAAALFPLLYLGRGGLALADAAPVGLALAVVSGAVTSGLGYALWYAVLPRLPASVAAVAQLTVPPIAMAGGVMMLGEALTVKFVLASLVILGGVALSVLGPGYFARGSSGS